MQVISSHVVKMSRLNHIYYNYNYYNCMVNNLNKRHDFISNFVKHVTVLFVLLVCERFRSCKYHEDIRATVYVRFYRVLSEIWKKKAIIITTKLLWIKKNKSCWAISQNRQVHHYLIFCGEKKEISLWYFCKILTF